MKDDKQKRPRLSSGLLLLLITAIALAFIILAMALFTGCSSSAEESGGVERIFVFIGDGMGINHVAATRYFQQARDSKSQNELWGGSFDSFPHIGLMSTDSLSSVTDSAASITAMLTGQKTENGAINYDVVSERSLKPFAAEAKQRGYAVGVISSTSADHATPAGIYACATDRYDYETLARQAVVPQYLDFLGAGGFRAGEDELIASALEAGFEVAQGPQAVRSLSASSSPILALARGGLRDYEMAYEIDRLRAAQYGGEALSLAELLDAALRSLEGRERFIIFCEAAKIDMASADGDLVTALYEVQALDDAVSLAVEFYEE
ncbi:MAG: alkaline phosphatase, partial [Oscillospiraceae bacterium]|nr:alkaline phosphatase [Oscillospiraceae bacterium]